MTSKNQNRNGITTAIIFTGEIRTLKKTISFMKNNLIITGKEYIFATLDSENDRDKKDAEFMMKKWFGNQLISIDWLNSSRDHFLMNSMYNLTNFIKQDWWKRFLTRGGSMIEYYQMFVSYTKIIEHEMKQGKKYDFIFRCRTDTIFNIPLDYNWLYIKEETIKNRINTIKTILSTNNNEKIFTIFMSTLLNFGVENLEKKDFEIMYKQDSMEAQLFDPCDYLLTEIIKTLDCGLIKKYICNGRYILTIRKNLMYLCKRDFFHVIPSIGVCYGMVQQIGNKQQFNAESQFRLFCKNSGLSVFNYNNHYDNSSLYEYDEKKFIQNGKCLAKMYCIVRK